jgi:hypothetical protein
MSPFLPDPSQRPPGWNPDWPTRVDPESGRPFVQDPITGTKYFPHEDDWRHWPHYDTDKRPRYRFPEKPEKPWPNQQRPPYGDQSPENPWNKIRTPQTPPKGAPDPVPWWQRKWFPPIFPIVPDFFFPDYWDDLQKQQNMV